MKKIRYGLALVGLLLCLGACAGRTTEGQAEQEIPASSTVAGPTMNIAELAEGNFQSVQGIWSNDAGERLVFNQEGMATSEYVPEPVSLTYYGTARMVVNRAAQDLREGFILEFIPAGVQIGTQVDDMGQEIFSDTSDSSRDRLWVGSGTTSFAEQGSFYYKAN